MRSTKTDSIRRNPRARALLARQIAANEFEREFRNEGLMLVRPDGHVAWRGDELPADALHLVDMVRGAGTRP